MKKHTALALACLVTSLPAAGADTKAEPAKTHVLFMGADLAVQRDKKFHRVEDVVGSELKIRIGKREALVVVSLRDTSDPQAGLVRLLVDADTIGRLAGQGLVANHAL